MKKRSIFSRIASLVLAIALVVSSANINVLRTYAKEIDETLVVPFGEDATYDPAQGIGFVWGAAGYELYTVTISSDNGYNRVYEDQTLGYHWYPDDYADGIYYVDLQGQSGDVLSQAKRAKVTIGNPTSAEPSQPSQPEPPVVVPAEKPSYTTVGSDLCVTVEGKHEDWVEWSNAAVTPGTKGATIVITGYEGYEAYQTRVESAGLNLEAGKNYVIAFDITSSKDKKTMVRMDDLNNGYSLLTDDFTYEIAGNAKTRVTAFTGKLANGTENARVFAGLGMIVNDDAYKVTDHTVIVENLSVYEVSEDIAHSIYTEKVAEEPTQYANFEHVTKSTYKSEADGGWGGDSNVQFAFEGAKAIISGDSFGGGEWAVQWGLTDFTANGEVNALEFDVTADSEGAFKYKFAESNGMTTVKLVPGLNHIVLKTESKTVNPFFDLSLLGSGKNIFENMQFVESEADPVDNTIVVDYDAISFDESVNMETYQSDGWGGNGPVNFNFEGGIATISSENFGWNPWAVQWKLLNLTSDADVNMFEFDVLSDTDKTFIYKNEVTGQMNTITVKAGEKLHYSEVVDYSEHNLTFDLTGGSGELKFYNVKFVPVITMGNIEIGTYRSEDEGGWGGDSGVKFAYDKTSAIISANSFGWNAWAVQWAPSLTSSSNKNTFEFDVVSVEDKSINYKNENTGAMQTIKLKAGVPYHYSENIDSNTFKATFDLTGGAGKLTIYNMKFGDAGLIPVEKEPVSAKQHDFNDASGDYADPGLTKEGYDLIWSDEFDGNYGNDKVDANTGLNLNKWAYQYGDGTTDCGNYGWGNQELQSYTGNKKNVAVNEDLTGDGEADGMLRITASYEENGYKYANESVKKYTSGRIRTTAPGETLFTTTYGYVEARIALPEVKGAWPAFWMLPESTEIYGGWPVSGELDILETTGTRTDEACSTLHWGTPAHVYKGSGYVKLNSELKYFHTYAVDWEPGKITWLYDGEPIYTSTDWASAFGGSSDSLTFDAPFDIPYYLILNLAVDSGNFGGAANKANFTEDINMYVDYVRVFQKTEGYAAEAERSAGSVNVNWEELAGKNLIADITAENLVTPVSVGHEDSKADRNNWYPAIQEDASATAQVYVDEDGKVWHKVTVGTKGNNNYSVQLIGHYDAKAGYVYKVSFDAYAEGGMVGKTVDCDTKEYAGWSTGGIMQFALTDTPASYSYTFAETKNFDNCRVEFNIGAVGTGDVYVSNVKVEVVDPALLGETESGRVALNDGNMIYNSNFDQGKGHIGYWTVGEGTEVSVPRYTVTDLTGSDVKVLDVASKTNYENIADGIKYYERRAQIKASEGVAPVIMQEGIPMTADTYTIKFDMFSEKNSAVKVSICDADGNEIVSKAANYDAADGVKDYMFVLTTQEDMSEGTVKLTFAKGSEVQLDNVTMKGANQKSAFNENPINGDTVWAGDNGGGQALEIIKGGNTVSMVNATSGGTWYSPQLISADFAIGGNITYKLSYKIRINGNSNETFEYAIQENGGSWAFAKPVTKVDMSTLEKTPDGYAIYEEEFTSAATIGNAHLIFGFGGSAVTNATVVVDGIDLSIVKKSAGTDGDDVSDSSEQVDESVFESDSKPTTPETPVVTPPVQNPAGNPGHNSESNPGHNSEANPGHNPSANPGQAQVVANPGRGNGRNNNANNVAATQNIGEEEVLETAEETTEETIEATVEETVEEVVEEVVEPVEEVVEAEVEIEEQEVPLAAGETAGKAGLIWSIIGALAALAAAAAAFFVIRSKKVK